MIPRTSSTESYEFLQSDERVLQSQSHADETAAKELKLSVSLM